MGVLEIVKKILKIKSPSEENRRHFSNMQSSIKHETTEQIIAISSEPSKAGYITAGYRGIREEKANE